MKSKIARVEITNIIDIESPLSKILIALFAANAFVDIMFARSFDVLRMLSLEVVFLLFTLYILNCYRSGGCNTLASISTAFLILFEVLYLATRVAF